MQIDTWTIFVSGIVLGTLLVIFFNRNTLLYLVRFLSARAVAIIHTSQNLTAVDIFTKAVKSRPNHPAIIFEDTEVSFSELDKISNAVSNWVLSAQARNEFPSFETNPCVALVFESRPEFISFWVGFAKLGLKSALINATIKGLPLLHAMDEANASVLIYGRECEAQVADVVSILRDRGQHVYCVDDVRLSCLSSHITVNPNGPQVQAYHRATAAEEEKYQHVVDLLPQLVQSSTNALPKAMVQDRQTKIQGRDTLFYIYTSGTTGLPKAAKISHSRFEMAGLSYLYMHALSKHDVIYCTLPLYHSAGGLLGLSTAWMLGATFVLRRKFSASAFFADCVKHKVTVIQYIGQVCRYLVASPPSQYDQAHSVKKALGNGLRKDVWIAFQERFKIPYIGEFYGSTEGNCSLVNTFGREGACGFLPPITRPFYPVRIVKTRGYSDQPLTQSKSSLVGADQDQKQQVHARNGNGIKKSLVKILRDEDSEGNGENQDGNGTRNEEDKGLDEQIANENDDRQEHQRLLSNHKGADVDADADADAEEESFDPMDPLRGPDGLCIEAGDDESGELLGQIVDTDPYRNWEGYSNKQESDRKVLRDVFEKGDAWFRTGDLMAKDKDHFIYFVDRMGDTFRWKGENCSCSEVENAVMATELAHDCIVYGVEVQGYDGRAGMLSMIPAQDTDIMKTAETLCKKLQKHLAAWQLPVFVRFVDSLDLTATLKHNKVAAQKRGWTHTLQNVYVLDSRAQKYVLLTESLEEQIKMGSVRL